MTDLAPPADLVAEAAVLSACLLHSEALDDLGPLTAADFYDEPHRRVFEAIRETDASGERVDTVTVRARLIAAGTFERIGGSGFLADLLDASPEIGHVREHAAIVSAKARVRAVVALCHALAGEGASTGSDPSAWLSGAEGRMFAACQSADHKSNLSTLGEMVEGTQAEMRERGENKSAPVGISTGFRCIDRAIGGFKRGNKYVLGAVPGAGKTALALQIAVRVAGAGHGVVFASLEMTRPELSARAVSQQSGVTETTIERGEPDREQWTSITAAIQHLADLPLVVDDTASQTVSSLRGTIRRGIRRLQRDNPDIRLGLIVIDHLHIQAAAPAGREASRNDKLTEMSNGNRMLAKEFDAPVLELNQLNRNAQTDRTKAPEMKHLRECGAIEQDAYGILMLHRSDVYRDPGELETGEAVIAVRKIRQGGAIGSVKLSFRGPTVSFYEDDPDPEFDDMPDTFSDRADVDF